MTAVTESAILNHRIEALANVVLTRRLDTMPVRTDIGCLDLFVKILSGSSNGHIDDTGIGFGVVFSGKTAPLATEAAASAFANRKFKAEARGQFTFFFPVIALVFSMADDSAWFAWIAKPTLVRGEPKLLCPSMLQCRRFDRAAFDEVVDASKKWFASFVDAIVET